MNTKQRHDFVKEALMALSVRQLRKDPEVWQDATIDIYVEKKPALFWLVDQAHEAKSNHDMLRRTHVLRVLEWVLTHGAEVDVSHKSMTPLMEAACFADAAVARRLLQAGANVHLRSAMGNTPLHWATFKNSPLLAKIFLEQGADINQKNGNSQTPLHAACEKLHEDMIFFLHQKGARWDIEDASRLTPLQILDNKNKELGNEWRKKPERDHLSSHTSFIENTLLVPPTRRL